MHNTHDLVLIFPLNKIFFLCFSFDFSSLFVFCSPSHSLAVFVLKKHSSHRLRYMSLLWKLPSIQNLNKKNLYKQTTVNVRQKCSNRSIDPTQRVFLKMKIAWKRFSREEKKKKLFKKRKKTAADLPFAKHPVNLTVCRVVDLVTAVLMTMRNHCLNHVNPMANEIWNAIKKPVQNLCSFQRKKSWKLQFTAANKRLTFGLQNCSSFWTFIMRSRISCGWNGKQMKQLVDATTLINLAKKHLVGFFLVFSWKKATELNWIEPIA